MSVPARTRFGFGYPPALVQQAAQESARTAAIGRLTRGLHAGHAENEAPEGYSPSLYNWVPQRDGLVRRASLVRPEGDDGFLANADAAGEGILGAWRMTSPDGYATVVMASEQSIFAFFEGVQTRFLMAPAGVQPAPSGTSLDVWDAAYGFDADPVFVANFGMLTNGVDQPYVVSLDEFSSDLGELSDYNDPDVSLFSTAKSVTVSDARAVWFNTKSGDTVYPTRVVWSARGKPVVDGYRLADGAGAEDLTDMRGVGTKVISISEGILLFTDAEVWKGRLRRDAYVYDFYPLDRNVGTDAPRTVVETPVGVMFLGRDREIYVVSGDGVVPLGPAAPGEESRVRRWIADHLEQPHRAWAMYNEADHRYELYYCAFGSDDPREAIYYSLEHNAFFPQLFGADFPNAGVRAKDASDEMRTMLFTSEETVSPLFFDSSKTRDQNSGYSTRWLSPALPGAGFQRERITDLWIDLEGSERTFVADFATYYGAGIGGVGTPDRTTAPFTARARFAIDGVPSTAAPRFGVFMDSAYTPTVQGFGARIMELGDL